MALPVPYSVDNGLHVTLAECRAGGLGNTQISNHDIAVDRKSLIVQDLLCAGNRAAIDNNPLISAFSYTDQFPNAPANAGKARAATIPFGCQLARGCIRELPDIRSDPGTGVDDPCLPLCPATARCFLRFHDYSNSNFVELK
jgi:hypothetical protein